MVLSPHCSTGQLAWGLASLLGIATIMTTSATAFAIAKWVGVIYLCYLGIRSLTSAWSTPPPTKSVASSGGVRSAYRDGRLTNALNPKTALFMSALLPQFLTQRVPNGSA